MTFNSLHALFCKIFPWNSVILFLITLIFQVVLSVATKCLKDEALGDGYEANVYYCEDEDKPECCEVDHSATCCENNSGKNVKEQLQLWGLCGVAIVAIAFVLVCWRKDTYLCEGDTLKERCKNCCRKKKKLEDEDSLELKVGNQTRNSSSALSKRESTSLTTRHIDPMLTSQNELQISDVDSGRGSVASSASHLTRGPEKVIDPRRQESHDIMLVQPHQEPQQYRDEMTEKKQSKKHKSKKKSKSKDRHSDSDENEDVSRDKKSSRKRKKKSKSKYGDNEEADEELDISTV